MQTQANLALLQMWVGIVQGIVEVRVIDRDFKRVDPDDGTYQDATIHKATKIA
jgi:hypothetical protein